ncbi:death-associated protein kinase related-like, partial [Anopheles cruzii]|uniref:death-associated protein kinase related-like n=1 Tax=Anopheles cruzii TaxID=68878 RepID=UPI0022EC4D4D
MNPSNQSSNPLAIASYGLNVAVRRSLTSHRISEARNLRGTFTKDYSGNYRTANFISHDIFLKQGWKNIENEIAVLWLCSGSEHIVDLQTVYQPSLADLPALYLRRVPGISLQEMLCRQPNISEQQVKMVIRGLLRPLGFLHSMGIAHLDLKPKKVLLSGDRLGEGVKLCGFRLTRLIYGEVLVARNNTIDRQYKAPEVLRLEPVSLATDIWSVGVMAQVMLTPRTSSNCVLPLPDRGPLAFINILRPQVSAQAVDFIDRCKGQQ